MGTNCYRVIFMHRKLIFVCVTLAILAAGCFIYKSVPSSLSQQTRYVVIGCSAAGFNAARELMKGAPNAHVMCLSEETVAPYDKTALHGLVKGKPKKLELQSSKSCHAVNVQGGKKVIELDRTNKRLKLADNSIVPYDKLLIATGARPYQPEHIKHACASRGVVFYNTLDDVQYIIERLHAQPTATVLIAGAGIRSLELADGLRSRFPKATITLLNRSARLLGAHGDDNTDRIIAQRLKQSGITFLAPAVVRDVNVTDTGYMVKLEDDRGLAADLIVFNQGTTPNSALAKAAGLAVFDNDAISVDSELMTSDPNIFAAGDVAGFKNPLGDGVVRSNKWRAAKEQGKIAARNMLGKHVHYRHEPSAFVTSFLGMKGLMSGDVRQAPRAVSRVFGDDARYAHLVVNNDKLKAFVFVWERSQQRPDVLDLRRALINQSPVGDKTFLEKMRRASESIQQESRQ